MAATVDPGVLAAGAAAQERAVRAGTGEGTLAGVLGGGAKGAQ